MWLRLRRWQFRWTRTTLNAISILGEEVEVVKGYRYLGVHLDNRQDRITMRLSTGRDTADYTSSDYTSLMCAARCCISSTTLILHVQFSLPHLLGRQHQSQ